MNYQKKIMINLPDASLLYENLPIDRQADKKGK
jgi:hypothetical protein